MQHSIRSLVLAGTLAACAPDYAYVPTTNATMVGYDRVAAQYPLPATTPHGSLQIASYGFANLTPKDEPGVTERALHLRAILINNGSQDWTFDTRQQAIELEGQGQTAPVFASASAGATPPLVTVPAGGKRVVDLFFPVPVGY